VTARFDTARYLALFTSEAGEHLEALSRLLVDLDHGATAPVVDELFRHAHSVKGMAASMGFDGAALLGHRLEDLLDALRADLGRYRKEHGDLALEAVDALLALVKLAGAQSPLPDVGPLAARLKEATQAFAPRAPVEAGPPAAPPSAPVSLGDPGLPPRFEVRFRISAGSNQPGVRGFLAYKRLSTLGNVFELRPVLEDLKAGRIPQGRVSLELETEVAAELVTRTLGTVADVELEHLAPLQRVASPVAPAPPPGDEGPRVVGQEPARTVRVKAELLDRFLDTAGELLLATARVRETGRGLPEAFRPRLDEAVDRLHGLVRGLHDQVMQARMTPVAVITDRLPRVARDIARRRGRDIQLVITGESTELDRAIVDELADPVLHLLRNAIDHGVEPPEERRMRGKVAQGTVTVTVRRARDRVLLEVADDGRGLDPERLKAVAVERGLYTLEQARALSEKEAMLLACLPGVSTAGSVSDISGRGVGMDAVKRAVETVGGSLDLESSRGVGTRVRLSLPLTVAMVNLLLVRSGDEVFGLPITKVLGVVETPRAGLSHSQAAPVLQFGPTVVPVHELSVLLGVVTTPPDAAAPTPLVVVETDDGRLALAVDALLGQEEVVLKALPRPLDQVPGLAGVTILGSGRPVFILDPSRLVLP
jgi:two-component system chemotaxis sensor kinase CheA